MVSVMGAGLAFIFVLVLIVISALSNRRYDDKKNKKAKMEAFLNTIAVEYRNAYHAKGQDPEFHRTTLSELFQVFYCGPETGLTWRSVMQLSPCVTRKELYSYVDGELRLWLIQQETISAIDEETALQMPTTLVVSLESDGG